MSTNGKQPPAAENDDDSAVVRAINAGTEKTVTAIANQTDSLDNLLACGRTLGVAYIAAATIPLALDFVSTLTADVSNILKALQAGAGLLLGIGLFLTLFCSYDMRRKRS